MEHRHINWSASEKKSILNRLARIEGQIKGIRAMLETDRECEEMLVQVAAARSGLRAFGVSLAKSHFENCVIADIKEGNRGSAEEFMKLFEQISK